MRRLTLFIAAVCWASTAAAQFDNPFQLGGAAEAGDLPIAEPAAAPAALPAARPEAATAGPEGTLSASAMAQESPAVRAALEWPRTNPSHAFRAVVVLVDLDHPELARPILEELQARQLDEATLSALVDEFGSYRLLQIAGNESLAPVGADFSDAAMSAAAAVSTNPARLAQLVAELNDASPEVRRAARGDLNAAGRHGVQAVLEALARESDPSRRANLTASAATMRPLVDGPLLAMLDTKDPRLAADVTALLAQLQISQAFPLIADAESPAAEAALRGALAELEQGVPPFLADADDRVELWFWNDETKSLSAARYPADDARVIWMARLAQRLVRLRPDSADVRVKALALSAEASGLTLLGEPNEAGGPQPQPKVRVRWQALSAPLVNDVLAFALATNLRHAAVDACDELGRRGDAAMLYTADAKPSPLAEGLMNGDRGVRFAALRAIMTIDPPSAYPGSSRVPVALGYFARAGGGRDALVAMPSLVDATDVAGKLSAASLHGEATMLGNEAVKLASQLPDLELILVDADILKPGIRQVLYELRASPASANLPIAVLATDGRLEAARKLAREHQRMIAVPRPRTTEAVAAIAGRLHDLVFREHADAEARAQQAVLALTWTANLLDRGRSYYALRRDANGAAAALYHPTTAASAVDVLARFHTPDSQRALATFASQRTLPIETRRAAARAFDASVRACGVLLTTDEILARYAIYNASETADRDTQEVLGSLLDAIESRRQLAEAALSN